MNPSTSVSQLFLTTQFKNKPIVWRYTLLSFYLLILWEIIDLFKHVFRLDWSLFCETLIQICMFIHYKTPMMKSKRIVSLVTVWSWLEIQISSINTLYSKMCDGRAVLTASCCHLLIYWLKWAQQGEPHSMALQQLIISNYCTFKKPKPKVIPK